MQFFQFDNKGNMHIYAPGAGCMAGAKFMAPGDELIFFTTSQWHEHDASLLSQVAVKEENAVASTCPASDLTEPSHPFNMPLPEDTLTKLSHKNFAPETLKKVR